MGLSQRDQTKHNTLLRLGTQSVKTNGPANEAIMIRKRERNEKKRNQRRGVVLELGNDGMQKVGDWIANEECALACSALVSTKTSDGVLHRKNAR